MVCLSLKEEGKEVMLALTTTQWLIIAGILLTVGTIIYRTGEWKGTLGSALSTVKKKVEALEQKVDKIYDRFFHIGISHVFSAQSPLSLSDFGKKIAHETNTEEIAHRYIEKVIPYVRGKNDYEVQEFCFAYADVSILTDLREHHHNDFNVLSLYAYNNAIPLDDVMRVIGLFLREGVLAYLKKEKE